MPVPHEDRPTKSSATRCSKCLVNHSFLSPHRLKEVAWELTGLARFSVLEEQILADARTSACAFRLVVVVAGDRDR